MNGAPFPASPTNLGDWVLVDERGNQTIFGTTANAGYSRRLTDGTYDVVYRWRNGTNSAVVCAGPPTEPSEP